MKMSRAVKPKLKKETNEEVLKVAANTTTKKTVKAKSKVKSKLAVKVKTIGDLKASEDYTAVHKNFVKTSTKEFRRNKLMEECGELNTSLARLKTKDASMNNVLDEMVDVVMCMDTFLTKYKLEASFQEMFNSKARKINKKLQKAVK